jgi:endoglucanase
MKRRIRAGTFVLGGAIVAIGCGGSGSTDPSTDNPIGSNESSLSAKTSSTEFFVPAPDQGAVQQVTQLLKSRNLADAARIATMALTPQAVWFNGGTPSDVQKAVGKTMRAASVEKRVPVLVSYNIPYRDCAQYSAGGAPTPADYEAWIDGFAAGIGKGNAVVILEPDSLGIIPWYNPFADRDTWVTNPNYEWCQPATADQATAAADRFAMLNYAVTKLKANAGTKVYLDGTHSGWLGAGDAADRLLQAGVLQADGFFLNISNYQPMPQLEKYAHWISECVWFADPSSGSWGGGHAEWCGSQYYPATASDFSTWSLTDQWYADNVESQTWVPYPGDAGLKHFIIDTSRNGNGPLDASQYASSPYNQPPDVITALTNGNWCNPPGAGLGLRPKANPDAAQPLLDAYLWVKIPGESDGSCDIAGGARGWDYSLYDPWSSSIDENHFDPLWGIVDPAAGTWFPQQALQLAQMANPPLF